MNKALWIAKKNHLCSIMRQVSVVQGGDDIDFLRLVCKETIEAHKDSSINNIINVYEEILNNLTRYQRVL